MIPESVMRESMRGADCTWPSRMMASWRPMFSPVALPNLSRALVVEREADGRLVVLVGGRPGVAQVLPGDDRHLAHQVEDRLRALALEGLDAGHHLHGRIGTAPAEACSSASLVGVGPCSTSFSSSIAVDWMISLARCTSVDARQLHDELVAGAAVLGHDRLGHAELVDAAVDRLPRLRHRVGAQPARPRSASS